MNSNLVEIRKYLLKNPTTGKIINRQPLELQKKIIKCYTTLSQSNQIHDQINGSYNLYVLSKYVDILHNKREIYTLDVLIKITQNRTKIDKDTIIELYYSLLDLYLDNKEYSKIEYMIKYYYNSSPKTAYYLSYLRILDAKYNKNKFTQNKYI